MPVTTVTIHQIVDAIETTLSAAASLVRSQTFDELSEGMQDYPTLQVYPEANLGVSRTAQTDRVAFADVTEAHPIHREKEYIIHADLFARQRSQIGEDMAQLVETIDEIEDILESQCCPLFGLTSSVNDGPIRSMRWSWQRVVFSYGGVDYMGARFILTLVVF